MFWTSPFNASLSFFALALVIGPIGTSNGSLAWLRLVLGWSASIGVVQQQQQESASWASTAGRWSHLSYLVKFCNIPYFHYIYNYFPTIWYVKIQVIFFLQFSYKSLLKFPPKFWQSLPYIGRSQVIDIYPVYTSNISHLITQSWPNRPGSQSHKHHHHHHNHNIYNIHWTINISIEE